MENYIESRIGTKFLQKNVELLYRLTHTFGEEPNILYLN